MPDPDWDTGHLEGPPEAGTILRQSTSRGSLTSHHINCSGVKVTSTPPTVMVT